MQRAPNSRLGFEWLLRCVWPSLDLKPPFAILNKRISRPSARQRCFRRSVAAPQRQTRTLHSCGGHDAIAKKKSADGSEEVTAEDIIQSQAPNLSSTLRRAPISAIYGALGRLRDTDGRFNMMMDMITHLIGTRGEVLNVALLDALVVANWDPVGSAMALEIALQAARIRKIQLNQSFFHNALRLLAIHPDYRLRNRTLKMMGERWIEVKPMGWCDVAIGLLRDEQHELAWIVLERIACLQDFQVPGWVWDIFIFRFASLDFLDEALQVLELRRQKPGETHDDAEISLDLWYFLLDKCSAAFHHQGTKYLWAKLVATNVVTASDGMAMNVLNTAARAGDSTLATEAVDYLSARKVKLGILHYEALVESYARKADIENALEVLCIMAYSNVQPTTDSTRSIFMYLKDPSVAEQEAAKHLLKLRNSYEIPIAAFNVALEALCYKGCGSVALNLYRLVRQLCPDGPSSETFQILLAKPTTSTVAKFLWHEMESFAIPLNAKMHDNVVHSFINSGDLDAACSEMKDELAGESCRRGGQFIVSDNALLAMIELAHEIEDYRLPKLVQLAARRGLEVSSLVVKAMPGPGDGNAAKTMIRDEHNLGPVQEEQVTPKIGTETALGWS